RVSDRRGASLEPAHQGSKRHPGGGLASTPTAVGGNACPRSCICSMSAYFDALNRRPNIPVYAPPPKLRIPAPAHRLPPRQMPAEYGKLREKLMVAAKNRPLRTLVFAGCEGGEGCTRVTREFAEALASSGLNMLLVDADLRTSGLTASIAASGPDLAAIVAEGRTLPGVEWGNGHLAVIPRPPPPPPPGRFFPAPPRSPPPGASPPSPHTRSL